jgi:threonyl-tRNA synthetase
VRDYGWFYDFDRAEPFTPEDLGAIEAKMKQIINARDPVKTEVWDRARAVEYYRGRHEPFKLELIDRIPEGEDLRMYWHGPTGRTCAGGRICSTRGRFRPMRSS